MTRRPGRSTSSHIAFDLLMQAINKSYSLLQQFSKTSSSSQWHEVLTDINYSLATLDLMPLNIVSGTCPIKWLLQLPISHAIRQIIQDASTDKNYHKRRLPVMNGRVQFTGLEQTYPTDGRIFVRLINGVKLFYPGDQVLLYHFTNNSKPLATFTASSVTIDGHSMNVTIDLIEIAQKLSHNERYYLSYVSYGRNIANSDSFIISKPNCDELVELEAPMSEDDDEFIVIKSEKALFQDRIHHLAYENGILEYQNHSLAQRIQSLEEELAQYKSKLKRLQRRV